MLNIDERLTDLRSTLTAGVSNPDFSDVVLRSTRRVRVRRAHWSIAGSAAALALVIGFSMLANQRSHRDGTVAAVPGHRQSPQRARSIDWEEAQVPGKACFSARPIQLHHGQGHLPAGRVARDVRLFGHSPYLPARTLTLLDVTPASGTGAVTAISLVCANDGGTAAGDLRSSIAVYDAGGPATHALGLLLAQHQPHDSRANLLEVHDLGRGHVSVVEHIFKPTDPDCCPSRHVLTVWTYQDGTFRPSSSHGAGEH